MEKYYLATLKTNLTSILVEFIDEGRLQIRDCNVRPRKHGGYYVSFWYCAYRYWGQVKALGVEFFIRKTNDYQYRVNHHPRQQVRLDKVVRSTRNRHAKSLY